MGGSIPRRIVIVKHPEDPALLRCYAIGDAAALLPRCDWVLGGDADEAPQPCFAGQPLVTNHQPTVDTKALEGVALWVPWFRACCVALGRHFIDQSLSRLLLLN